MEKDTLPENKVVHTVSSPEVRSVVTDKDSAVNPHPENTDKKEPDLNSPTGYPSPIGHTSVAKCSIQSLYPLSQPVAYPREVFDSSFESHHLKSVESPAECSSPNDHILDHRDNPDFHLHEPEEKKDVPHELSPKSCKNPPSHPSKLNDLPPIPIPEDGFPSTPGMVRLSPYTPNPSYTLFPQLLPQVGPNAGPTVVPLAYFSYNGTSSIRPVAPVGFLPSSEAIFGLQMAGHVPILNFPQRPMYDTIIGNIPVYPQQMSMHAVPQVAFGPPPPGVPPALQTSSLLPPSRGFPYTYPTPAHTSLGCTQAVHVPSQDLKSSPIRPTKPRKTSLSQHEGQEMGGTDKELKPAQRQTPTKSPFKVINVASAACPDSEARKSDSPKSNVSQTPSVSSGDSSTKRKQKQLKKAQSYAEENGQSKRSKYDFNNFH